MSTAPGFSLGVADPKISQPTTPHIRPKKRMRVDCNAVDNMARLRSIEESPNWNNTAGDISGDFIRWGYSIAQALPAAAPEGAPDESSAGPQYSMVCESSATTYTDTNQQAAVTHRYQRSPTNTLNRLLVSL